MLKMFSSKKACLFYLGLNLSAFLCFYTFGHGIDRMIHQKIALGAFDFLGTGWYGFIAYVLTLGWWNE